jgi:hypothetical protein
MSKRETDKINVKHESQIEDLPVTDEQADKTKAGGGDGWIEVDSFQWGAARGIARP